MILFYIFIIFLMIISFLSLWLFIPINYKIKLKYNDSLVVYILSEWGFLSFTYNNKPSQLHIKIGKMNFHTKKTFGNKVAHKPPRNRSNPQINKKANPIFDFNLFKKKNFVANTFNLLNNLLKILKPNKLKISGYIGLEEPHETAMLFAYLTPLQPLWEGNNINLNPLWDEKHIQLDLHIAGKFTPKAIIMELISYLLKPEIRTLWVSSLKTRFRLSLRLVFNH